MRLEILTDAFLTWLVLNVLHGTALFGLTWLVCATLLRRSRPSIQAAVWTVVLIKFLLPPVLPGNFGISGLLSSVTPQTGSTQSAPRPVFTSASALDSTDGSVEGLVSVVPPPLEHGGRISNL